MNDDWTLHYARWVIEDGQPDRDVGEIFDWFAPTFWSDEKLSAAYEHKRLAVPVGENQYRVVAEVTYLSDNIVEPRDLPITKGLQHCIHDFEALDLYIALSRILEHAVPGPQIDLLYSEETEARLPAIARGLSPAFTRTFKIIDRQIKHLATEQWDRAFRIFDLLQ